MGKLDKAGRLAKNIQIMLKSKAPSSFCINRSNERAFHLAVKQLGMRLDEFYIEDDCFYLQISLKRDFKKDTQSAPHLLERPQLPKTTPTHPSRDIQ